MIYLDNAATSFPKPPAVWREQMHCMRTYCGNPGRGSHLMALKAAEKLYECREALTSLMGCPRPENVIFTMNTTMAINIAVKGLLEDGDHVLLSDMEHNAVLRPIACLADAGRITFDVFPTYPSLPSPPSEKLLAGILERIRPNTRLLICAHASNICSASLPIREIGALCRARGILFVVDAAQSAGHLPIDMEAMQIDALCLPGHKGLWGPQGCGALLLREGLVAKTLLEGGSGYQSLEREMPQALPERHEAGTLPTPAIAGLCEGIREVARIGVDAIHDAECRLTERLVERLSGIPTLTLHAATRRGGILLFHAAAIPSDRLAQALNARGFCVRSGLHCAPLAHKTLGTPPSGAIRVSPSFFNTPAQIDAFADALREMV